MSTNTITAFEPRKVPIQSRSTVTVEAISAAAIQVLLSDGAERLTTTRVADRAGVSVGTLYQYYPNKQSLLFTVLENHFNKVASGVEEACERARHKPLAEMIRIANSSGACVGTDSAGIRYCGRMIAAMEKPLAIRTLIALNSETRL